MYVLEFRTANRHHTWLRCAICETKAPLERVSRGQPNIARSLLLSLPRMAYSAPSRNGAGRLRKMEKRTADAVRPKIRIMI